MSQGVVLPKLPESTGVNREEILKKNSEMSKQLWSGKLTPMEQKALTQVCMLYGLDPLLKHVLVMGGNFYITKGGLLVIAYRDEKNAPEAISVFPATKEEREAAGITQNDAKQANFQHYWRSEVWKKGSTRPFIEFGEAEISNVKLHAADWKAIQDMAKTRAVNRALRNAYAVGMTSIEEMGWTEDAVVVEATTEPAQETKPEAPQPDAATPPATPPAGQKKLTEKQMNRFWAIAKGSGHDEEEVKKICTERWGKPSMDWGYDNYNAACEYFQNVTK